MRLHIVHLALGALLCTLAVEIHSMRTPDAGPLRDMPPLLRQRSTAPAPMVRHARRGPLNMNLPIHTTTLPSTQLPQTIDTRIDA